MTPDSTPPDPPERRVGIVGNLLVAIAFAVFVVMGIDSILKFFKLRLG